MPSTAHSLFLSVRERPAAIVRLGRVLPPRSADRGSAYLSAIMGYVASWQAYIEALIDAFYHFSGPVYTGYRTQHYDNAWRLARDRVERFRTPNSQNVRELVLSCTGYDCWVDWEIKKMRLRSLRARQVLDDLVKIRHRVAHGDHLPEIPWAKSGAGVLPVSAYAVNYTDRFVSALVEATDKGMQKYIRRAYGVDPNWW